MKKRSINKKSENKTLQEIYDAYHDEMKRTLDIEELDPSKFGNIGFVEYFERKVDKLDALIALYADLLSATKD